MTWIGVADGTSDIGQKGISLEKLQDGYTAIIALEIEMMINFCSGSIDGVTPTGECPKIIPLTADTHQIISSGQSGGFRIYL